jgi:hypothetical protein
MAQQTLESQIIIIEASWSQSGTLHSVGLLCTSDKSRPRDLYLKTNNIHETQTSMYPAGSEPAIPVSERPQIHALDRAAIGFRFAQYSATK